MTVKSAFYVMDHVGSSVQRAGTAFYIGHGCVVGVDSAGNKINGTYEEENDRLKISVVLAATDNQITQLVTGDVLTPGHEFKVTAEWPVHFDTGEIRQVCVEGKKVGVRIKKIGDIPD